MTDSEEIKFIDCTVPFTFEGRYFILEPGTPPLYSVILVHNGKPMLEIRKNEPVENPISEATKSETGTITVSEKEEEKDEENGKDEEKKKQKILYHLHPGSETRFVFGKIGGGEISVVIWNGKIKINGITLDDCAFNDVAVGVQVDETGGFEINAPLPQMFKKLFRI